MVMSKKRTNLLGSKRRGTPSSTKSDVRKKKCKKNKKQNRSLSNQLLKGGDVFIKKNREQGGNVAHSSETASIGSRRVRKLPNFDSDLNSKTVTIPKPCSNKSKSKKWETAQHNSPETQHPKKNRP